MDCNTWFRMEYTQLNELGWVDALREEREEDINIRAGGSDDISPMNTCKEVALETVHGAESPGKSRLRLVQHYRTSDFKK